MIDAIAWKFQTGSQWVHLPERYGSRKGAYTRLRNWAIDGTWERGFTALLARADADEGLDWWSPWTPPSSAPTSTRPRGPQKGTPADELHDHTLGCSR